MSNSGYTTLQIRLHWFIALLILIQVVFHEGIVQVSQQLNEGIQPSGTVALLAELHVLVGLTLFVLVLVRILVRIKFGTPPLPPGEKPFLQSIAKATHFALYALMVLMPVSGALAWFGELSLATRFHGLAKPFLLLFVFLHFAGAIYQHFVLKTDVLRRMLRTTEKKKV